MSVCLDRFAEGLPDIQEELPMTFCAQCGGDIYAGEGFTTFEDDFICRECKDDYRRGNDISREDWLMFADSS